eukprot:8981404-Pyramimonas_sp.AAC.1
MRGEVDQDMLQQVEAAIENSRLQQVKFGLYSLARHPSASKLDKTGASIRENLGQAWEKHKEDQGLHEYLGGELVQLVTDTLAIAGDGEEDQKETSEGGTKRKGSTAKLPVSKAAKAAPKVVKSRTKK